MLLTSQSCVRSNQRSLKVSKTGRNNRDLQITTSDFFSANRMRHHTATNIRGADKSK